MVSSKCCQVVSPSPFRFFAALIPPCAQTECERLTGTIEKRSTVPPASAILITADRPASPPPTTMILGVDAMSDLPALCVHFIDELCVLLYLFLCVGEVSAVLYRIQMNEERRAREKCDAKCHAGNPHPPERAVRKSPTVHL